MHPKRLAGQKPYYVIAGDYLAYFDGPPPKSHAQAITYAIKRAGITGPTKKSKS